MLYEMKYRIHNSIAEIEVQHSLQSEDFLNFFRSEHDNASAYYRTLQGLIRKTRGGKSRDWLCVYIEVVVVVGGGGLGLW